MGILGRPYFTRAIGRDVLTDPAPEPGALIYGWAVSPATIGFVQGDYYYHSQGEITTKNVMNVMIKEKR